jgi:hypothetical protein
VVSIRNGYIALKKENKKKKGNEDLRNVDNTAHFDRYRHRKPG